MGAALSYQDRELIINQKLKGKSLTCIAREQNFSYSTTCRIWRRFKTNGMEGLAANYSNCGPTTIKRSKKIHRSSVWLKRKYPKWGAPFIMTILKDRYPTEDFPSVRTMQLWFRKAPTVNIDIDNYFIHYRAEMVLSGLIIIYFFYFCTI